MESVSGGDFSRQQLLQQDEERGRLLDKIHSLETELRTRQAFRAADNREDDEIAAEEILDEIEAKVIKTRPDQLESDSDEEGDNDKKSSKSTLDGSIKRVLKYVRDRSSELSSMLILIKNDTDLFQDENYYVGATIFEQRTKDVLIETMQDMTFRFVLELVCEYWGIPANDGSLRLVDERGTWHRLDNTVIGSIRPSRRHHPVLYLQGRKEVEHALRELQHGRIDAMKFTASTLTAMEVAPLLLSNNRAPNVPSLLPDNNEQDERSPTTGKWSFGQRITSLTAATRLVWKTDPILFTWRRVMFDFLLALTLFIVLCILLAATPKYRNSTGVSVMVRNSLVDVSFQSTSSIAVARTAAQANTTLAPTPSSNSTINSTSSIVGTRRLNSLSDKLRALRQMINSNSSVVTGLNSVATWGDLLGWINGPLTAVVTAPFFLDPQNMLYGPVRFRQNRVRPISCVDPLASNMTCFPAYYSSTEQRDAIFGGTPYVSSNQNPSLSAVSGQFADYGANAYVIEVHAEALEGQKGCPAIYDASGQAKVCTNAQSNASCWECVIDTLSANNWLDDGTRLFVVEFLVFSADDFCFFDAKFAFELGISGFIYTSYETRYISASGPAYSRNSAFVVIISILISLLAVQFFQCVLYIRSVWKEAKQLYPKIGAYFALQICWSLPTRFTLWNPIIFALCVAGMVYGAQPVSVPAIPSGGTRLDLNFTNINSQVAAVQNGLILLGVANMAVAYKLSTYFEFTMKFVDYLSLILENLFMLCIAMTLAVSSFSWLLTMSTRSMAIGPTSTFGDSFVFVVRLLLNQISPEEFNIVSAENWFTMSWVFYAGQIVLNLVLVKIAAPICYHGLKQGLGEYILDSIAWTELYLRKWVAT